MSNSGPAAREKPHSVRKALLLGCVVALLGAACGQRGPLYLPEREPAATPAAAPAALAAADDAQSGAGEAEENSAEEKDAERLQNSTSVGQRRGHRVARQEVRGA